MMSVIHPSLSGTSAFNVSVDQVTESAWAELQEKFGDASIYQTWAYGAVSWSEKQLSHLVLKKGDETVALAQLRIARLPVIRAGVAYLRWGPVCHRREHEWDGNVFEAASRALVDEYVHRRHLMLRVIPLKFDAEPAGETVRRVWGTLGFRLEKHVRPYRTIRVDLTAAPEIIRKRFDGKWRNQLNGAERNNLTVQEGTGDELYEQFLALYDEMMARKQFETTVDVREFRRIQQRLADPHKMLIMIGAKDGALHSGLVASAVGETGIYLLGATSNDGMKSKSSYLLQWRMMNRLKERGCRWYDLGGINPDKNPGVFHFKQGMGGQEVVGLGRFMLCGDPLSRFTVAVAERVQSLVGSSIVGKRVGSESDRRSRHIAGQVSREWKHC